MVRRRTEVSHELRNRIYWANALFSVADREFNAHCAERLREAGYDVFLPQEAPLTKESSPAAKDVFRTDTEAILSSHLLVAGLDQEAIDSGVACEIGIAHASGVPIVGLYTDIRQFRRGRAQMYKNLYVIGAVETSGRIVSSLDELLRVLPEFLPLPASARGEGTGSR